jgi:AraC-like DNA-binding protein
MHVEPLPLVNADSEDIEYVIRMLSTRYPVCDELQKEFYKYAFAIKLDKGQHLLHQGDLCHHMYFIRKGALMAYSMHQAKKITTYISVENEFVSSLSGLYGTEPSRESIVAVEPTLALGVHTDVLQQWYQRFFDLNYIIRQVYEMYYRDAQERAHIVRIGNAKERYQYFLTSKPGFIDRLPLDCVASFLDMKSETLLRIKKEEQINVSDHEAKELLKQVEIYMLETKCFKDKTLKVQDLATCLSIPAYKLSRAVNTFHKKSFTDFVNQYRISYIKVQLDNKESLQNFTIEALALQAGFASRSGFYKAFNKMEGLSPKAFLAASKASGNTQK